MIWFALASGAAFGLIDVAVMLPLHFPSVSEKRVALVSAGIDRFLIGFVIGPIAAGLGWNGVLVGVLAGVAFSLPTALITRIYAPIIALGAIGGLAVGLAYELVY